MARASNIYLEIDGEELKDFVSITIRQSIYSHNEFEVVCRRDTFEESDTFTMEQSRKLIGSLMTISIEHGKGKDTPASKLMFKGLITSIRSGKSYTCESDQVILSGCSPDILLSDNPGCCSFENKTLKQIVDEVLKPYPKDILKTRCDPSKNDRLSYVVQYDESRYDFLQRLAIRYGEWFFHDGTQLHFGKLPDACEELKLGINLNEFAFSIRLNPLNFRYIAYDSSSGGVLEAASARSGGKDSLNKYGGHAHDTSMDTYKQQSTSLYNHLNVSENSFKKELGDVVKLEESAMALSMSVMEGSSYIPQLKPGCKVNIKAPKESEEGEVDYGKYIITSVCHTCDDLMNYHNSFEGIPAEAKIPDYTDPKSFPRCNTQSAIVKDNNDPDKLGRVRVRFCWQDNNMLSPWLRPVNVYSGSDRGFYFVPEIDDEVLVGFYNDDAEKPYLIGSMYHGKNKPAAPWPDKDNSFKGILTRSKLKIEFDDKKKITTIETPGGNKAVLSDDGKSIILHDQNKNKVELTTGGITLESVKDIKITSQAKITIEGTRGVEISSPSDIRVSGLNIDLKANAGLTARGNATAELSATGQTTVKGAIVMIN